MNAVLAEVSINSQSRIAQILAKKRLFDEKMKTAIPQGLVAVIQVNQQYGLTNFEQVILLEHNSKQGYNNSRPQNKPYNKYNNRGRY
jgi:hypothetical protein